MKSKILQICGKEVGVGYCMATEQAFEEIANKSIRDLQSDREKDLVLLVVAALTAYNQRYGKEGITVEELMFEATPQEITTLITTVAELRREWYEIPSTIAENDHRETDEEGTQKN